MYKLSDLILGSSNPEKIQEYNDFGLNLKTKKIQDLREVEGTELEVILHKVLELNEDNVIVEDTSLQVENADIGVNARWFLEELKNNPIYNHRKATWTVFIGFKSQNKIYIFNADLHGVICQSPNQEVKQKSFGFDSFFIPDGCNESLFQLREKGLKSLYSPRKKVIENLINQKIYHSIQADQIPKWVGKYQMDK